MNRKVWIITVMALLALVLGVSGVAGQGPEEKGVSIEAIVSSRISYQGVLKEDGAPVTGNRDMVFRLYSDGACTTQVGGDIVRSGVPVAGGLFSVELDVDQAHFNGQGLWLEVEVAGTAIACRELLPVPYALGLRPGAEVVGEIASGGVFLARNASAGSSGMLAYIDATSGTPIGVLGLSSDPAGVGVLGAVTATSGLNFGVLGQTDSSTNGTRGVYGYAAATWGNTYGVSGQTNSSANGARGVYGWASSSSGATFGVHGRTESTAHGAGGVFGEANGSSGATYGVYGLNQSSTREASGVYGYAAATAGATYGVYGQTQSATSDAAGVFGEASRTSGATFGVYGLTQSAGNGAKGVYGYAAGASGMTYGVLGESASTSGQGVAGYASATSGNTYGVHGVSISPSGHGVYGYAMADSGDRHGVTGVVYGSGWGLYTPDNLYVGGTCTGCTMAFIGQNGSGETLQVGDVVAISGVGPLLQGHTLPVLAVRRATNDDAYVLGVVRGRGELYPARGDNLELGGDSVQPVAGEIAPGDYLFVVTFGLAQVRLSPAGGGQAALVPGQPLTVGTTGGTGRPAAGSASPVFGTAVDVQPDESGLIWAMISVR